MQFAPAVDFFDATHGFAIWTLCPGTRLSGCTSTLQVTQDGKTWQRREPMPGYGYIGLRVLGPSTVVVDQLGSSPQKRLFSSDAGQTWHEVPLKPVDTVAQIPAGAILQKQCMPECDGYDVVGAVLADSGMFVTLATPPPFVTFGVQPLPDTNGTWWVQGLKDTGEWLIGASRDNGRSWQVSTLPKVQIRGDGPAMQVIVAPDAVYAAMSERPWNLVNDIQLAAILRSTDGGRTWERTWSPGAQPGHIAIGPLVGPDGTLIAYAPDKKMYTSKDGGHTFQLGDSTAPAWSGVWTRAGYLSAPSSEDMPSGAYPYQLAGVSGEIPRP
jgi:hypothetical protein